MTAPQGTVATVVLDDVDVTAYCIEGSTTRRLNRPATASVRINMQAFVDLYGTGPYPAAGSYLKIYFENSTLGTTPVLWHHGRVLLCETTADEEGGYTVLNSSDPLELWQWRPVRDLDGDFSKPDIIDTYLTAPQIVENMLIDSDFGTDPGTTEGPTRLVPGSFATGGIIIPLSPTDWPMTMAELATLLVSTGELDIVITPIEFDANNNFGIVDCYNGDYGNDLSSSVAFQYGMGDFNVRALRWSEDMSNMCNKLWYYLGPKCDDQHWPANITGSAGTQYPITAVNQGTKTFTVTGDASGLDDPPLPAFFVVTGSTGNNGVYTVVSATFGGVNTLVVVEEAIPSATANGFGQSDFYTQCALNPTQEAKWIAWHNGVVAADGNDVGQTPGTSRNTYDVRMDIQIFDALGDFGTVCSITGLDSGSYCLLKKQWLEESWIRSMPRTLVHITPTRDTAIGDFDIGDLVLVEASAAVKGGFSGVQRVYEYTISWDAEDSVCAIGELQVSSDNEGFGV